jgi:hypothetical protein
MHLIIQLLDAMRSFEKSNEETASYGPSQPCNEQAVGAHEHATVTINDVQRFLMQRNAQ